VTREVEFLYNDYTNPNTNPKTFTTLVLTLADNHDALKALVRRYFVTLYGTIPKFSMRAKEGAYSFLPALELSVAIYYNNYDVHLNRTKTPILVP